MREGWLATLHCLQQNLFVFFFFFVVIGEYNPEFYFGSTVETGRIMIK